MKQALLCILLALLTATSAGAQEPYTFPEDIKPLIKTYWGQGYPFNLLCPKSDTDEALQHNLAGCGPVAMAQMVNYHQYPSMSPDGKYEYDWELMYRSVHGGLSKEELVAVAKRTGNFTFNRCRNLNYIVLHDGLRVVGKSHPTIRGTRPTGCKSSPNRSPTSPFSNGASIEV